MNITQHNTEISNERPAVDAQNPIASGDRRSFSFGGNTRLTVDQYKSARYVTEQSYGNGRTLFDPEPLAQKIADGITCDADITALLNYGRRWIAHQSWSEDMDRRRPGSTKCRELEDMRGSMMNALFQAEDIVMAIWPDLRHKEIRTVAALVADSIDYGIDSGYGGENLAALVSLARNGYTTTPEAIQRTALRIRAALHRHAEAVSTVKLARHRGCDDDFAMHCLESRAEAAALLVHHFLSPLYPTLRYQRLVTLGSITTLARERRQMEACVQHGTQYRPEITAA